MSSRPRSASRVHGFDGLRALAALVVFVEHKVRDIGTGAIGVWVFFCLSGYLIVGILQRARREVEAAPAVMTARRALLNFWKNRALRILPLYYAVLLALFVFTSAVEPRAFPYYLFYVQNVYIALVSHQWSACSHFWSLALEQQFSLAGAPLLVLVPARLHEHPVAAILGTCVLLVLGAELVHCDPFALSLLPPTSFAFMALGGLARLTSPASLGARLSRSAPLLVATGSAFAVAFVLTRASYDPLGGPPLVIYATGLLFSGCVVSFVAQEQRSGLVRFLELAPLRWLGVVSYGFYVYHPFVPGPQWLARVSGIALLAQCPRVLAILFEFAEAALLAALSWHFFERRFLRLKARPEPTVAHC